MNRKFSDNGEIHEENSQKWEDMVLQSDPFDGDFGDSDDRTLMDKIVVARKSKTPCSYCFSPTVSGTKIRVRTDVIDGEIQHYRWCHECCHAFVLEDLCCDSQGRDCDDDDWDDNSSPVADRDVIRAENQSNEALSA